jgi:hypothetical protein
VYDTTIVFVYNYTIIYNIFLVCEDTNHQCSYLVSNFNLCDDVTAAFTVGCISSCGLCRKYKTDVIFI